MHFSRTRDFFLLLVGTVLGLILGVRMKNCTLMSYSLKTSTGDTENKFKRSDNRPSRDNAEKISPLNVKSSKLLFAGVMTTKDNLKTRALAASATWAPSIHADVNFFCGMTCNNSELSSGIKLTILPLTREQDTYPPQRKSFMMLKYMYENHLNDYEWFLRADDDVYVNGDKLTVFLSSLNSSKLYYIGQPAFGRKHERGKLGLPKNKPYCMGGPGIVISRRTLATMGPHINYCMEHLYTEHEDTELARCIYKFVRIPCIRGKRMPELFHNSYDWGNNLISPSSYDTEIQNAITLHPLKNHQSVYSFHKYLYQYRIQNLYRFIKKYQVDILGMNSLIPNVTATFTNRIQMLTDGRINTRFSEDFWTSFNGTGYFSHNLLDPIHSSVKHILRKEHKKVPLLTKYVRTVGHKYKATLSGGNVLRNLKHGYFKVNANIGAVYMLTVHAKYGQKWFDKQYILQHKFSNVQCSDETIGNIRINVIVPISGRHAIFMKFLERWEQQILNYGENVSLTFIVTEGTKNHGQFDTVYKIVHGIKTKYPLQSIHVVKSKHHFHRAYALQKGADRFGPNSLLFFLDIDCSISPSTLYEIRANTIRGKQVYFPIVFSQYNPKYKKINTTLSSDGMHNFSYLNGYWRFDGYGMISIYKSDLTRVGGFNTRIKGWGNEDIDFLGRVLKKKLSVFRAPSLGLIHIFHSKHCHEKLSKNQYISCEKVKWETDGSQQILTEIARGKLPQVFTEKNTGTAMPCPKFCTSLKSMKINRAEPLCTKYC